jgi:hypothetical protein
MINCSEHGLPSEATARCEAIAFRWAYVGAPQDPFVQPRKQCV